MKIRQAPISDLIKYLYEQKEAHVSLGAKRHILYYLDAYYCSITNHKTILPVGNDFITDWCDLNNSMDMRQCPNIAGVILFKKISPTETIYALTAAPFYHGEVNCFTIDYLGDITLRAYPLTDWDGWAVPTRYFHYSPKQYIDGNTRNLGERTLSLNDCGHDVKVLQTLLFKAHSGSVATGYFDEATLAALKTCQSWLGMPESETFDITDGGKQIIDFLTVGENK